MLARSVRGCCIAYATAKAEIVAGLVRRTAQSSSRTTASPFKHCWMEKSMWGQSGNIILHRLSEICTEIEVTAEGGIVARIPGPEGEEIQVRGTLCSLSALTNMILRRDPQKILRPSGTKNWEDDRERASCIPSTGRVRFLSAQILFSMLRAVSNIPSLPG
jgi:hypothetical protein